MQTASSLKRKKIKILLQKQAERLVSAFMFILCNIMVKKGCFVFVCFLLIAGGLSAQSNTLEYYISQALDNSPLLKDYRNQQQTNSLDSQRIRAIYRPQVNGTSFNSYSPVIGGYGYDGAITNGGNVTAHAGVNKTLVSRKNLGNQFETLHLAGQSIANTAKISEQDLKRTITAQYITAYGDLQQLNFSTEIYTLLRKEDTILKTLTEHNVYRQTDYLTFLVTFQQQELVARQLAIQYQNDFATLNYLSGLAGTDTVSLQEPAIVLNQLPPSEYSVFYRQYTLDSLKLVNNRAAVDFGYKPKVNLFADAGYNSTFAYRPYKNFGTSFGVSVTVPIYDGRQKRLQYQKLGVLERTRAGYKDFFERQKNQQVAQLMVQLKSTQELIEKIKNQIKYADGLIRVNTRLLETGDAKIADLVIALNNYLAARNLLTQNTVSQWQIINQINYWNR
jgi:outer membrane protein TolC